MILIGTIMFTALATVQPNVFFGGGASFQQIHLDELRCSGAEATLLNCTHSGVGVHDCEHHEDVGIICNRSQGRKLNMPVTLIFTGWISVPIIRLH